MNSNNKRESGILLHLTSLPSDFGIGDLGPGAYYFVDLLEKMGQKLWQILPTNPPSDDSYSPYSTDSAFANNTLLISLEELRKDGFLSDIDFIEYPTSSEVRLELDRIVEPRLVLLEKAINQKESLFIDEAMHNNLYDYGIEKTVINFTLKLWK